MGHFDKNAKWHDKIYQIERTDPVIGGEGGISNQAPMELADRTEWLKQQMELQQCNSIAELRTIEPTEDKQMIYVKGYYANSTKGGGYFVADFNDSASIDDGDLTVATNKGKRWKRASAEQNNWGSVLNYATKRRILHNLPITFPDYQAVLSQIKTTDTWLYPQAFTVSDSVIYVLYYSNVSFKPVTVCFDFITGAYLGYYILGNQQGDNVAEGIVVKGENIFIGRDGHIIGYRLTQYGEVLAESMRHNVNLSYQFSYAGGEWVIEQKSNRANNRTTRHRFAVFDDDFKLMRFFDVSPLQSGYPSTDEWLPKRQSVCTKAGYVLSGTGAYYDANRAVTMSNHQGVSLTIGGTVLAKSIYEPKKLLQKFNHLGYSSERVENEGCFITDDGRCLSLTCIKSAGQSDGGLLLVEEFSQHPNAIDFADCAVMPQFVDDIQSPFGYLDNELYNPLNGLKMTTLTDVCLLMTTLNKSFTTLYIKSDNGLTVKDGVIIPKYSFVDIYNGDGYTHLITIRNKREITGKFLFYPSNGDIRSVNENLSGALYWTKPIGAESVYHRAYSESYDNKLYHWLDLQHDKDKHDLILGGSTANDYAFNTVRFATSKGDGNKGYYIHWNINETGAFLPNGNNKAIGAPDNGVREIYTYTASVTDDSKRVPNTNWVKLFFNSKFSQSISKNGWQKLPSGLILQWASFNTNNGNTFDFPIAFNQVFNVYCTDENSGGNSVASLTVTSKTNTSFSVKSNDNTGLFSMWAIGK